jgi:KUP system potassium uptake protein
MAEESNKSTEGAQEPVASVPPDTEAVHPVAEPGAKKSPLLLLCLTSLGVVYGDIGTSPLYALRECFRNPEAAGTLAPNAGNVLGVLSLIFWALIIVISVKYLLYVMRADNNGEGGILALLALIHRKADERGDKQKRRLILIAAGIFGAALLYGDGMITPAISVLSAIEGLEIATPVFTPFIIPITVVILVLLFAFQRHGTARIGLAFGPITLLWFVTIGALGIASIIKEPSVLAAVNPWHAVQFFLANGWFGFTVLGAVFLVVTGGEALYADMGHLGARPIRVTWFALVLPALLLNYFGQGALILRNPSEVLHPFFHLAPSWMLYPLVALSTAATVIASQAVITGAFSLTSQAVALDEFPRVRILQTSGEEIGQIYIPLINWLLMICCIGLVIGFRSSGNLAGAYGIAVTTTMVITTFLAYFVAREIWGWSLGVCLLVTGGFLIVDVGFFGANILKIFDGGWFPLLVGAAVFAVMSTWRRGRSLVWQQMQKQEISLAEFLASLALNPPVRVKGTSVFMSGRSSVAPVVLLHHLKHNKVLKERIILMTVETEQVPYVPPERRIELEPLDQGFYRLVLRFGFMETPDVPKALRQCRRHGLKLDPREVTFYVGHQTVIPSKKVAGMAGWREHLFAFLTRNATRPVAFFNIPPGQVVELGMQVEI